MLFKDPAKYLDYRKNLITQDEILVRLLDKIPVVKAMIIKEQEYYYPEIPGCYTLLGELASIVVARVEEGDTSDFKTIFAEVERWHYYGDSYVREAATIGFLENLQNLLGHKELSQELIESWLGSRSLAWWERLNRFWSGDVLALQYEEVID